MEMELRSGVKKSLPGWKEATLTAPSFGWLAAFFFVPVLIVLALSFRQSDLQGGVGEGWTLANIRALADAQYWPIYWRTLWVGGLTVGMCLLLALPASYAMARLSQRWKNVLLLLVIVPFWTNFLIRVFAWKSLLHPEGLISQVLQWLHWIDEDTVLLYNNTAVILVMVYTQLPFAILPLYAAAEKFDFQLLEAASDLGASKWQAIRRVFLPGIGRGILAAGVMVFVATLGMYVVPDVIGGTDTDLIGNKIAQRAQSDRNLPLAGALSLPLLLAVAALLLFAWVWSVRRGTEASGKEAIL